jgi:hypothetical protein
VDELWQRYRTFFTPVLVGLGVLLVGVIVVYVVNDDPDEVALRVSNEAKRVAKTFQPTPAQIAAQRDDWNLRKERVQALANRLDQAAGAADPVQDAVAQALGAAILRGGAGAPAFGGDAAAAAAAQVRYDRTLSERVDLLRTGDPNVGFSRLLNDVWSELRLRANRADVDLNADQLGFSTVSSVNRSTLLQRLLNLALAARVVDVAVRSGVESVDEIRFENRANAGPDAFLQEWPVTFIMTGRMEALRPVLSHLTDTARTTPILGATFGPPRRSTGTEGRIELVVTASSLRVQTGSSLNLGSEE